MNKTVAVTILLFSLFQTSLVAAATDVQASHSYVIKGGISLGSYESGLNWYFIERLRKQGEEIRREKPEASGNVMKVVAGASAGGINAIVSAVRFCQADEDSEAAPTKNLVLNENLFFNIWDVYATDLLPELGDRPSQTSKSGCGEGGWGNSSQQAFAKDLGINDPYSCGLLRRSALIPSLEQIYTLMQEGDFRKGCTTHVALPITVLKDQYSENHTVNGIDSTKLRYAVPLKVAVDRNGSLFFSSLGKGSDTFQKIDDFMYLEEDSYGHIPYIKVLKLALAGSSFPLAFAPMNMQTCLPDKNSGDTTKNCSSRTFIDGGSLDNAPIGLAIRLTNFVKNNASDAYTNIIYINPAHKESTFNWWHKKYSVEDSFDDTQTPGLQNYFVFMGKLLNYGMNAEYAHATRNMNPPKMTKRHYMLTGEYLMNFGAFIDQDFREFDFLMGIYDAVAATNPKRKKGDPSSAELYANQQYPLDTAQIELFNALDVFTLDVYTAKTDNSKKTDCDTIFDNRQTSTYLAIAHALCSSVTKKTAHSDDLFTTFNQFIDALPSKTQQTFRKKYPNFGQLRVLKILLEKQLIIEKMRLLEMEEKKSPRSKGQGKLMKVVAAATLIARTMSARESDDYWPRCTAAGYPWLCLIPDEIGIDGLNSVPYISYHGDKTLFSPSREVAAILQSTTMFWGFDPYHWGRDNRNTSPYTGITLGIRHHRESAIFSSFGVGLANYYNWKPAKANNRKWDHGLHLGVGLFADKLHLSIIQRDTLTTFDRTRFTFLLGIRDVGGISDFLFGP